MKTKKIKKDFFNQIQKNNEGELITSLNIENNKFIEIASSLAYYLKLFSNLKRYLEYVSLASKHIINCNFSLIIPLDEKGKIWVENIYLSNNSDEKIFLSSLKEFLFISNLLKNFRIKDINQLDDFFKRKYPTCILKSYKIISRGKCRGFFYIFDHKESFISDQNISFLLNMLAVGIENYVLLKINKKHENIDREISSGAEIQSRLLPDFCPKIFGVNLAAHCRPALQLGGDYYDFMSIKPNLSPKRKERGRWALVIGDVMGKGIPAGLLMTMLRGMLRAEVLTGLPPDRILHDLNQLAIYDLDQSHRFVTLFYSDYDPRTKKLRYANAAHNPPLLWKNCQNKIIKLDANGFIIGLQKNAEYECGEIQLTKDDLILYYTDGITEASNTEGERFGEKKLITIFSKLCKKKFDSQKICNEIFKTLDAFAGEKKRLDDDASVVILKCE